VIDDDDDFDKQSKKHKGDDIVDKSSAASLKGWLIPNIRVRILDKKVLKGRCYMKKGSIVDVPRPGLAVVRVDEEDLCEVNERDLETALPKAGGLVIIVVGPKRGLKARLLERDSKNNRGVVQLMDDFETIPCRLDDVAEFVA